MSSIKIPLTLTILSPVHIGSGEKATVGQDLMISQNKAVFLSFDKIIQQYANDKMKIEEIADALSRGENALKTIPPQILSNFILYEIPLENSNTYMREISTFIKDANGLPYIPATSLKGSLRTLVLQEYLNTHKDKIKQFVNDSKKNKDIENYVFGADAKEDPFKAVRIDDIYLSIKDLSIKVAKVFDISNDGRIAGFRKSGKSTEITDISSATPIVVEAVETSYPLKTTLYIDKFEIKESDPNKKFKLDENWFKSNLFSNTYDNLCKISKLYALKEIDEERKFLDQYGKNIKNLNEISYVIEYYNKLKEMIEKDGEAIYLRTGWGIGWKGMTGDYLSFEDVKKLNIPKRDAVVFPKTRRFATKIQNGKEYAMNPFGWIKLRKE